MITADLAGSDLKCLLVPEDEPAKSIAITPQVLAGQALDLTVRRQRRDGKILDLEVHAVPLAVDDRVRGSYTIYKDISEQIKASEAERKHGELLNQLVTELQLRTGRCLSERNGRFAGVSAEPPRSLCRGRAVSAESFCPKSFPEPCTSFAHRGTWWKPHLSGVIPALSEGLFSPDACWGLRRGQPHWSEPAAASIELRHLAEPSSAYCLCVPMVGHGDMLGILHLEFARCS